MTSMRKSGCLRLAGEIGPFDGILGSSPTLGKTIGIARKFAVLDDNVLIMGETGTGKELFAEAIHKASCLKNGPFVAMNCAAIPEGMLESELFGHEKGSFTGAHATVIGMVEKADGGTLFLDEVGEMPQSLQSKLLRFLDDGTFSRLGGKSTLRVSVRVIAATNRTMRGTERDENFREDFFHRLGFRLTLPPLRARGDDLIELALYFLGGISSELGSEFKFSPDAIKSLRSHQWPGNVRELRNCVRQAAAIAENDIISSGDLGMAFNGGGDEKDERALLLDALNSVKWNKSKAARVMNWSRMTLYRKIKFYEIGSGER